MTRLWDKGAPLDERVLRFTAGEDHALDNRLVAYDVRASIAHAEMLQECGLLAQDELDAIRNGLTEIAAGTRARRMVRDARPRGRPDRARNAAHAQDRHRGRTPARRSLAQRPGAHGAAAVPARCRRGTGRRRAPRGRGARRLGSRTGLDRAAGLHAHAAGDAEFGRAVGAAASPRKFATTSKDCVTRIDASARTRSAPRPATALPTCL